MSTLVLKGRWAKLTLYAGFFLSITLVFLFISPTRVHAFTPNYDPSDLIDDPTLLDKNAMGPSDIQSFLSNEGSGITGLTDVEACDGTDSNLYAHCGQTISAAQIIYDAGQAYGINPKAILATMEKEESLVTDPAPNAGQINCAMGYNSCSGYVGFFTQVDWGTYTLRFNYEGSMGHTSWLGYDPATHYPCGGASSLYSSGLYPGNTVTFADPGGTAETITIANGATATLYCYTPYVGPYSVTGYSGSYNFVYYFDLWFGTTYAANYYWGYVSHAAYADAAHTQPLDATQLTPGQLVYVELKAQNLGHYTWYQQGTAPMRLGTWSPQDRISSFCDASWISCSRPTVMQETSVAPLGIATFDFVMKAPSPPGTYNEHFNLVADSYTWLNDPGFYLTMTVKPIYLWSYVGQQAFYDSAMTQPADTTNLSPGQRVYLTLTATNTGNVAWSNSGPNPVYLGGANPNDRVSQLCDPSWVKCSRPALLNESSVMPGSNGTFGFWANVPTTPGIYNEYFNLVAENFAWFNNVGLFYTLKVNPASYMWSYVSQGAYTDSGPLNSSIPKGELVYLTLAAKNIGNATWYRGGTAPLRLGSSNPYGRTSWFCYSSWISCQRPAALMESSVPPGQVGHFIFTAHAPPDVSGTFNEYFNLLAENLTWLNNLGLHYTLTVQ